ncbi:MAG: DUF4286 family protein [Alistipes sp.]|nr:DUF4286 family protein [Alistipes sp.]
MYIVNTSFMVDPSVHDCWMESLRKHYLPLLQQEAFGRVTFTRVLSAGPEDHYTYSLQIEVDTISQYKHLTEELLTDYTQILQTLFADRVLWFNSLMKQIEIDPNVAPLMN